jgi:hypothetical protein
MKFDKRGNGNGFDDLYILPESDEEREAVLSFLKERKMYYEILLSNVPCQEWSGKRFIEVPFCECMKGEIMQSIGVPQ